MIQLPQLLLIGGTGRNVGKTTLASMVVKQFSADYKIVGLKISNVKPGDEHLHGYHDNKLQNNYILSQEENVGHKDSQRLLTEGATRSYYLRTKDEHLQEAFTDFLELIDQDTILVCESYTLRNYVEPGIFLMIEDAFDKLKKPKLEEQLLKADFVIKALDQEGFNKLLQKISIQDNKWTYSK